MTITAKLAEALRVALDSQRLNYDVVAQASSALAEYEAAKGALVGKYSPEQVGAMAFRVCGDSLQDSEKSYCCDMLRAYAATIRQQGGRADGAAIRKVLDECDVPLAYQQAIVERLTTALAQQVDGEAVACIHVPRALVEKWAKVDAFNAPKGAAMELRTIAGEMLLYADAAKQGANMNAQGEDKAVTGGIGVARFQAQFDDGDDE